MLYKDAVLTTTLELLEKIMAIPSLSGFYLAGDTSLALQLGHRLSVDLDFFGQRPFSTQELLDELHDLSPLTILTQSQNILVLDIREVKVDFINYRYPLLSIPKVFEGLRLLSPQDIGAMKLAAIAGRGRKRDFYNLFFLLQLYTLPELIQFYLQKYDDGSELMVVRSLVYFDDADQDEDPLFLREHTDWVLVKKVIEAQVKERYA